MPITGGNGSGGGGGSAIVVSDEGVQLTAAVTSFDFVGAGVTATNVGDAVTVTVPSGTVDIGSSIPSGTAGSVLFVGSGPVLAQDNTNFFWDASNARLGIGVAAPASKLDLNDTANTNSSVGFLKSGAVTVGGTTLTVSNSTTNVTTDALLKRGLVINSSGAFTGLAGTVTNNYSLFVSSPSGADQNYSGVFAGAGVVIGTGTPTNSMQFNGLTITLSGLQSSQAGINVSSIGPNGAQTFGVTVVTGAQGAATTANVFGVQSQITSIGAGGLTNGHSFRAVTPSVTNGTLAVLYGIKIDAQKTTNVTTGYGVYVTSALDLNYFAGKVGIGQTVPAALLNIAAGTATAGTGPLQFTSGTNLTTPENGTVEYDGTKLYFTPSAATRKVVVLAPVSPSAYTPTNVTTDRTYDANSTTLDEIADVLGTLIADLQATNSIG